jgi:hypothetical protein
MTKIVNLIICFILAATCSSGQTNKEPRKIKLSEGEKVWAGIIDDGYLMPFSADIP